MINKHLNAKLTFFLMVIMKPIKYRSSKQGWLCLCWKVHYRHSVQSFV